MSVTARNRGNTERINARRVVNPSQCCVSGRPLVVLLDEFSIASVGSTNEPLPIRAQLMAGLRARAIIARPMHSSIPPSIGRRPSTPPVLGSAPPSPRTPEVGGTGPALAAVVGVVGGSLATDVVVTCAVVVGAAVVVVTSAVVVVASDVVVVTSSAVVVVTSSAVVVVTSAVVVVTRAVVVVPARSSAVSPACSRCSRSPGRPGSS